MRDEYDFTNGEKNPFHKKERINDLNPGGNAPQQNVDLSLLTDEERIYYMKHGKLPLSPAQAAMMEQMKNEATADMTQPTPPVQERVEVVQERIVEDPIPQPIEGPVDQDDGIQEWTPPMEEIQEETLSIPTPTVEEEEEVPSIVEQKEEVSALSIDREFNDSLRNREVSQYVPLQEEKFMTTVSVGDGDGGTVEEKLPNGTLEMKEEVPVEEVVEKIEEVAEIPLQEVKEEIELTEKVQSPVVDVVKDEEVVNENTPEETSTTLELVAPDDTYRNIYQEYTKETEEISAKYSFDSEADFEALNTEVSNPASKIFKLQMLNSAATANRDFNQMVINHFKMENLRNSTPNEITPKDSSKHIRSEAIKSPDKVVKGKQAKALVAAKTRGTKKVFLINSGFYVVVRPLSNYEISEFVNTLRTDTTEYGRILGAYFYLYANFYVKQFFADKILSIVTDSNLERWKQGTTLIENISLHDFKTILWACASLMFKDGVEFTKICAKCQYVEKVMMDLSKLYFTNSLAIMDAAYPSISGKKSVSVEDVKKYQSLIKYDTPNSYTYGSWKIDLKVPSVKEYLDYAEMFLKKLQEEVTEVNDENAIQQFTRFTYLKQYSPWIKEIANYENGELLFKLNDEETIFENISDLDLEDTTFSTDMEEYIQKTMLTYIAFPYVKCPACGYVPENVKNGFVAYDIETSFFTMCVIKSREVSSRLEASMRI